MDTVQNNETPSTKGRTPKNKTGKFGSRLRAARVNARYTQRQVEQITHISAKVISNWEHDVAYPNLNDIKELANCYKVSADYLLGVETSEASFNKPANQLDLIDLLYPHDSLKRHQLRSITLDGAIPNQDMLYRMDPAQIAAIRQFVDLALEAAFRHGESVVEIHNEGGTNANHQGTVPDGNQGPAGNQG